MVILGGWAISYGRGPPVGLGILFRVDGFPERQIVGYREKEFEGLTGTRPDRSVTLAIHARPFVGVFEKSIFKRPCQFLAMNAHKMAPRTTQWLQERRWDAPTKGLAWIADQDQSAVNSENSHVFSSSLGTHSQEHSLFMVHNLRGESAELSWVVRTSWLSKNNSISRV